MSNKNTTPIHEKLRPVVEERIPMLSIHPDAANNNDVAWMAAELMEMNQRWLKETKRDLELFKDGMLYAASLNIRCMPNECDGVDFLKKEIRKAAKQLKELPQ